MSSPGTRLEVKRMSSLWCWSAGVSDAIRVTIALATIGASTVYAGDGAAVGVSAFSSGGHGWMNSPGGGAGMPAPNSGRGHRGGFGGVGAVGSGSNVIEYNPPIIYGIGPNGPFAYSYPLVIVGPGGYAP